LYNIILLASYGPSDEACKRLSDSKYPIEISNTSNSYLKSVHIFYGDFSSTLESTRRIVLPAEKNPGNVIRSNWRVIAAAEFNTHQRLTHNLFM
jgi:hypothetical protein